MKLAMKLSAMLALATMVPSVPLLAQVTEVARTPISDLSKLTFGYFCDDKFVVRNDGDKSVDLEYAIEKGTEHTKLALNAHELVELNSKSKDAMELWVDGKLVAKAPKEKRACKDVQGNGAVTITPFEVAERSPSRASAGFGYGYGYGYGAPYGLYDPWGLSFYSRFGAWGGSPYFSTVIRVPVVIGNRGGGRGRRYSSKETSLSIRAALPCMAQEKLSPLTTASAWSTGCLAIETHGGERH